MTARRDWSVIITEAARIADSYDTSVTLRQLHYRLVAAGTGGYANDQTCYKQLSALTAEGRRDGTFPTLSDRTRGVERPVHFRDPAQALTWLADIYRRDRTEGQEHQLWCLFEKSTLASQIEAWTEQYGIPTAALRGYSSESLEREVFAAMASDGRPVVAYYTGDLDPEGEDIERNFAAQAERQGVEFQHWERLAVTPEQVAQLGLVPNPGKETSSRAAGFVRRHGVLVQIEVESIDPAELERLVTEAVTDATWFDRQTWDESQSQERRDVKALRPRAPPP